VPTVALVHATPAAMAPARTAFAERFPQARLWNLLDDRLIVEAEAAGGLTPALRHRMHTLIRHAVDGGADGVLLSCSMYGPVAVEVAAGYPVPVLASDQALFDTVAEYAARRDRHPGSATRVAVLGPIRAGVDDTVARLRDRLASSAAAVTGTVVDGVHDADGDPHRLAQLVVDAARRVERSADVIVLGQFSISPAQPAVQAAVNVPVLSPTHLAADVLRARLATAGAAR
jgi:Asp/Glu/hydantoin racemase